MTGAYEAWDTAMEARLAVAEYGQTYTDSREACSPRERSRFCRADLRHSQRSFGPALQRNPTKHCGVSTLGTKAGSMYSLNSQKLRSRTKRSYP